MTETLKALSIGCRADRGGRGGATMMLVRYRQFRSYGHGPVVAAILAPTAMQVLTAACAFGMIMGLAL